MRRGEVRSRRLKRSFCWGRGWLLGFVVSGVVRGIRGGLGRGVDAGWPFWEVGVEGEREVVRGRGR